VLVVFVFVFPHRSTPTPPTHTECTRSPRTWSSALYTSVITCAGSFFDWIPKYHRRFLAAAACAAAAAAADCETEAPNPPPPLVLLPGVPPPDPPSP
jgi:hypothetical protein